MNMAANKIGIENKNEQISDKKKIKIAPLKTKSFQGKNIRKVLITALTIDAINHILM